MTSSIKLLSISIAQAVDIVYISLSRSVFCMTGAGRLAGAGVRGGDYNGQRRDPRGIGR